MLRLLAIMFFLLFIVYHEAGSQNVVTPQHVSMSIDTDFMQMRHNGIPNFRYHYDDFLQYTPGVALLGMKAFSVPGMTKVGRFAVSTAFSTAIMVAVVNGVKYTVKRLRPDFSTHNSFPSGHTATAFMTATLLHKEYGWKYPWISILGYTAAGLTGISRVLNNRHWVSDVVAGAATGIGSVHLGYYLAGLIFKDRYFREEWYDEPFVYNPGERGYWSAEMDCGRRFILGSLKDKNTSMLPYRGAKAAVGLEIPVVYMVGVSVDAGLSSLIFRDNTSFNVYSALGGVYWSIPFARVFEFQAKAAVGYAWHKLGRGLDFLTQISINLFTGHNFRIKGFAEYETFRFSGIHPMLNSFVVGWATGFSW